MKSTITAVMVIATLATACSKPAAPPQPDASSAAPAHAAVAVKAGDPKAFLAKLYARYNDPKSNFSPFDTPASYFDAPLMALMDAADRATPADEVGPLDGDPICDCQDYRKLSADIEIKSDDGDTVVAVVNLHDQGVKKAKVLTYQLARRGDQWRIHDIGTADTPSLRKLLINSSPKA